MGGDVEEILTLYYNNDVLKTNTMELTTMYKRVTKGKYNHSMETMELYKEMTSGQRRKTLVTLQSPAKEEGCSNPFG